MLLRKLSTRSLPCSRTTDRVRLSRDMFGHAIQIANMGIAKYAADQYRSKINAVQKEIGQIKKVSDTGDCDALGEED